MNSELLYGAAVGNVLLLVGCLIGLLVVALRASGKTRWFAVTGFSLLLLSRIVGIVENAVSIHVYGAPNYLLIGFLLTKVLTLLGLVALAVAFVTRPRTEITSS